MQVDLRRPFWKSAQITNQPVGRHAAAVGDTKDEVIGDDPGVAQPPAHRGDPGSGNDTPAEARPQPTARCLPGRNQWLPRETDRFETEVAADLK